MVGALKELYILGLNGFAGRNKREVVYIYVLHFMARHGMDLALSFL